MSEILGTNETRGLIEKSGGDFQVTDAGRTLFVDTYKKVLATGQAGLPYPCAPKITPVNVPSDIEDREKYKSWHDKWIDGAFKSMLVTLNLKPTFLLPVFDPTGVALKIPGLDVPNLSFEEILLSFMAPQYFVPVYLNVPKEKIPDFLKKLSELILPKPPIIIPDLPKLPEVPFDLANIAKLSGITPPTALYSGLDYPNFPVNVPSNFAFKTRMALSLPFAFAETVKALMDYNWAKFNLTSVFELGCQALQKTMPEPAKIPAPPGYKGEVPAEQPQDKYFLTWLAGQTTLMSLGGETLGAAALTATIGGNYINRPTSAGINLGPGGGSKPGGGAGKIDRRYEVEKRNQLILRTTRVEVEPNDAKARENGLERLQPRTGMGILLPQRGMSYGDPITIMMLEGLADHMNKEKSYRKSPHERPMFLEVGNIVGWDRINNYSKGHFGGAVDIAYPMRDENGLWMSGIKPDSYFVHGKSVDFGNSLPYKGNMTVPETLPNGKFPHDFAAMYEIARWIFQDFQPKLMSRVGVWRHDYARKHNHLKKVAPFIGFSIGPLIYKEFSDWVSANKKDPSVKSLFFSEEKHEDHMHLSANRQILKSLWDSMKSEAEEPQDQNLSEADIKKEAEEDKGVEYLISAVRAFLPAGKGGGELWNPSYVLLTRKHPGTDLGIRL